MIHIKRNAETFGNDVLELYKNQDSATVHEAMGRRGAMDSSIKPIAKGMKICGRALTCSCHSGDNIMLIKAISMARPGDVVVADKVNARNTHHALHLAHSVKHSYVAR